MPSFPSSVGIGIEAPEVSATPLRRGWPAKGWSVREVIRRCADCVLAIEGGAEVTQAKPIAEHACRIADHYLKCNPRMVAQACAAAERYFFPDGSDNATTTDNTT